MSEPIIRMAEKTARGLACKRELARAIAAKEKAPQPKTADDILVAWQLDCYARVLRPDEPRDSQAAASRPLAHQPGNQKKAASLSHLPLNKSYHSCYAETCN